MYQFLLVNIIYFTLSVLLYTLPDTQSKIMKDLDDQKNLTYGQKKKWSVETEPEMIQILELSGPENSTW